MNSATQFRTLLVLGRVSNLPTVWSNCLAGWWLSGGGNFWNLPLLFLGVSALYTGGMFLNDAFDADFDRQRRAERPIPSGKISADAVWSFGWAWLALGNFAFDYLRENRRRARDCPRHLHFDLQRDAQVHHRVAVADGRVPFLGLCHRGNDGNKWLERMADLVRRGAGVLHRRFKLCRAAGKFSRENSALAADFAGRAGFAGDVDEHRRRSRNRRCWLSLIFVLWIAFCMRTIFQPGEMNVGRIVSGLLAGIIFVDWLAVAPQFVRTALKCAFLILFGATILLQRFIPAT